MLTGHYNINPSPHEPHKNRKRTWLFIQNKCHHNLKYYTLYINTRSIWTWCIFKHELFYFWNDNNAVFWGGGGLWKVIRKTKIVCIYLILLVYYTLPIPGAVRSKAWVCGRSLTRIVGSNPSGGKDVCVVFVVRTVVWNVKWREGRKDLNSTKIDQRGKTPDSQKKKIPVGARDFSLLQNVQTGCGDHAASY
jgi:hypothetical protein